MSTGWSHTLGPVQCPFCGKVWPNDPALAIKCPTCQAEPGEVCKRPSGHGCARHPDRMDRAIAAGFDHQCDQMKAAQLEWDQANAPEQVSLL